MNVEQRLTTALRRTDNYEPSPDLWARVVHSIEEDRAHRQRVRWTAVAIALSLAGLVVCAVLGLEQGPTGRRIDWRVLEGLETIGLVGLVVGLGPAVRRFGRGYCADMFRSSRPMGAALLLVLDVAFYLVFAGYILLSVDLDTPLRSVLLADQLGATSIRVGGLLLAMGLLHAITFMFIPLLALIHNSTRTDTALPRWVTILLIVVAVPVAVAVLPILLGLLAGAS
ncbi:MAG: hypothetical protein OEV40_30015 [Acidimicrobiia bacterium]|nr:hypothetical protein [Acidimicrobiia bacterium]